MTTTGSGLRSPDRAVRTVNLPAAATTAAAARTFVVEALSAWRIGTETLDDAELVVSELVTNAFLHGHASEVAITLTDRDDLVRLEVAHQEAGTATEALTPLTAHADDTHGRGLAIVDVLSRSWGVTEGPGTRRVWAELGATRSGLIDPARREPSTADLTARVRAAPNARGVGDVVTAWAGEHLATSFAGVALVTTDRAQLQYLSVVPLPPVSAAAWARFPVTLDAPAAAAFRDGRAWFHESRSAAVAAFPGLGPALADAQVAASAHLPLRLPDGAGGHGVPFGTVTLAWEHGRELDAADRAWLTTVAAVVAAGLVALGATTSAAAG